MTIHLSSLLKGLVLHTPLDKIHYNPATKRVTDLSAYGRHGTAAVAASFTTDRMGQANRAMDFDGSNDYIDCGSASDFFPLPEFTISAWINTSAVPNPPDGMGILHLGHGIRFGVLSNGSVFFLTNDGSTSTVEYSSASVLDGNFNNVLVTRSSTRMEIFLNGEYDIGKDGSWDGTTVDPAPICKIGVDVNSPGLRKFLGTIASIRLYNRILPESERTLLYNAYRQLRKV